MGLLERLFKKKKVEQIVEEKEDLNTIKDDETLKETPSIIEKYPHGLPATVLELIDYSKFGAMLKQEKLLPPSYDKRPSNMRISYDCCIPKLKLRFRSTTSNSYKTLEIYKYNVSCASKGSTTYYSKSLMEDIWCKFAEEVMYKWDKGYRFELIDQKRKCEIEKTLIQDEIEHEYSIK